MEKKGTIVRDLQASLDAKWAKQVDPPWKDQFSRTVSDLRKIMSQSYTEEKKLVKVKSMYMSLRQDRILENYPIEFQTELAGYFDDERDQGPQNCDKMSSSQRCQQSAQSLSQCRKQALQSREQKNLDNAKFLEDIKRLEQDVEEERKTTEDKNRLLENRELEIKEKDGKLKRMEEENEDLAKSLEEEKKKYSYAERDVAFKQETMGKMEMQLNEYSSLERLYKQQIRTFEQAYKHLEKEKHHLDKSMQLDRETMKDEMASAQRKHDDKMKKLVVERDDLRDRCQQSAQSLSQCRKQALQSREQKNLDNAKFLEDIKRLEQDVEEERKKTENKNRLLENRELEIKEKDGKLKRMEEENEDLAKSLEEEKKKYSYAERDVAFKQETIGKMEMQLNEYSSQERLYKQQIRTFEQAYKHLEKEKHHLDKSMQRDRETMKDEMASAQRKHDDKMKKLVVERDDLRDRCQQSAQSLSQCRKQALQSREQKNLDNAKFLEDIKRLEQDVEEERKKTENKNRLLENRELEIKEKDGKLKRMEEENEDLAKSLEEEKKKYSYAERDVAFKQETIGKMEMQLNEYSSQERLYKQQIRTFEQAYKHLEKEKHHLDKSMQRDRETMKDEMASVQRKHDDKMKKLVVERGDDLRDRFSKLAGAKLQDQNADIADLSDPNRAMKLSERFGQIYDDEWTNAFQSLTDKKINVPLKEAIALLLRILEDCLEFCNVLVGSQMDSLKSVVLHPAQDLSKYAAEPRTNIGALKDRPRIGSKDEQALRVLRRQIGVSGHVVEEIKQVFLLETKGWGKDKKGYDKKLLEICTPYLQKCAEICWLMVLHDPPLYMKLDSKHGEKLNLNIFTAYSTSGDKLDYIVWPPLYNGRDGGLLSKGSAEPLRTIAKKK